MKKIPFLLPLILTVGLLSSCKKDEHIKQGEAATITLPVTYEGVPDLTVIYDNTHVFLDATKEGALSYTWLPTGETSAVIEFVPNNYCPADWFGDKPPDYLGGYSVLVTYSDTVIQYSFAAIYIESIVWCPTGFTPNQDGINDSWIIQCSSHDISIQSLNVFSEDGKRLHHATQAEFPGWDGKYKGQVCPIGTYYFTLHFTNPYGVRMSREGSLQIIR